MCDNGLKYKKVRGFPLEEAHDERAEIEGDAGGERYLLEHIMKGEGRAGRGAGRGGGRRRIVSRR